MKRHVNSEVKPLGKAISQPFSSLQIHRARVQLPPHQQYTSTEAAGARKRQSRVPKSVNTALEAAKIRFNRGQLLAPCPCLGVLRGLPLLASLFVYARGSAFLFSLRWDEVSWERMGSYETQYGKTYHDGLCKPTCTTA